mgnify:CR=1 FL=1
MSTIAENIAAIRARIDAAARQTGRTGADITLVAATKMNDAERVKEAVAAGVDCCGENRVQEIQAKRPLGAYTGKPLHFIGHLQTNKVKYIAPFVRLIHSVDSARLAEAIQKEAAKCGRTIDILLEIHVAEEETKTGWNIGELMDYVRTAPFARMPDLCVRGVMGIATNTDDEAVIRRDFGELRRCFELLRPYFGARFDTLSMGMSHDYPLAVECGATMVRVGSLIFGERDYSEK